jgi:hypothetical protein
MLQGKMISQLVLVALSNGISFLWGPVSCCHEENVSGALQQLRQIDEFLHAIHSARIICGWCNTG